MFRVVPPFIIWIANNCIYSIWYLSDRYCYLPLKRQAAVTAWQIPDAVDTVVCAPDDGWWYHPKHVEQFPDINKLCNVASCWIHIRIFLRCTDPWTLNSLLFFLKEDSRLTTVMIFVPTSVNMAFSDKKDSRKTIDLSLKVSFRLNQSKNSIYSFTACIPCSESLHTKCVVYVCLT